MTPFQEVLGFVVNVLLLALVFTLLVRGHTRVVPLFTLYVAGLFMTQAPIGIWPERFYTWQYWLFHAAVQAALRFGVAVELAHRVFGSFPRAAATALNAILIVLTVTAVTVVSYASPGADYTQIVTVIVPRIAHGTAWALTVVAALLLWYRLPLAPLQRAILLGMTPHLLVFTVSRSLLAEWGWHWRDVLSVFDVVSWQCLLSYWILVAWRTEPATRPTAAFSSASPGLARTSA